MNKFTTMVNHQIDSYGEIFFFAAAVTAVFIKFYFLECYVSDSFLRQLPSVLSSLGIILCVFTPVILFWHRVRAASVIIVDFLLTALIITDILYMRYYSDLFSFLNLGLSTQVGEVSESVFALFHFTDILYFADFPLLIGFIFLFRRKNKRPLCNPVHFKRCICVLLLFTVGSSAAAWRIYSYHRVLPGVLSTMWDRPAACNNIGAPTYHIADAWNIVREICMREKISDAELDEIKNWYDERRTKSLHGTCFGKAAGKNVIILQVESLQQFVVGLKVNGVEVTPNLNKFIRDSYYFTRIYNQTAAGNSADAEFMANTGLFPAASGVAYTRFAKDTYEAMPKLLSQKGYNVLAFHGDRPGFWNRQNIYPSLGFNKFVSKLDFDVDENIGMGLSDKSFFRQTLKMLSKEKKPFYAFMITLTSHYPFDFPEIAEQAKFNVGSYKGMLIGNYLTAMHYFDTQFGTFIDGLRKNGILDSSVLVMYGDHPAIPIWDRSNLEKLLGRELSSSWKWREMQKVPLIIHMPSGVMRGRDEHTAGGLIDVPETVMSMLGYEFPIGLGHDLFERHNDAPVVFRNGSFIVGNAFAEPAIEKTHNVVTGKQLDYNKYREKAEESAKYLKYSDLILEHNLVPLLNNSGSYER